MTGCARGWSCNHHRCLRTSQPLGGSVCCHEGMNILHVRPGENRGPELTVPQQSRVVADVGHIRHQLRQPGRVSERPARLR